MSIPTLFANGPLDQTAVAVLSVIGAVAMMIIVPTTLIVQIRIYKQRQLATDLVRDLIAQGMSAADIERVLMIWSADQDVVSKIYRRRVKEEEKRLGDVPPAKPIKGTAFAPQVSG